MIGAVKGQAKKPINQKIKVYLSKVDFLEHNVLCKVQRSHNGC